jgi:hypothetical protein
MTKISTELISPILLGPGGAIVDDDPQVADLWSAQFGLQHAAYFPDFLNPDLGDIITKICQSASFAAEYVCGVGDRQIEVSDRAGAALSLALRDRPLLAWLSRVAGRGDVTTASGSVARLAAGTADALDWHDDRVEGRRLAITIDLSTQVFEGGAFEMRRKGCGDPLFVHTPSRFGSALIFQVRSDLEHRVLPVTSGGPRTTFSGWFLAERGG